MNTTNKDTVQGNDNVFEGISIADGNKIYKPQNEVYLDEVYDSEEDKKDIAEVKKNTMTGTDKKIISVLWALNAAVFAFIGIYLFLTNSGDEYAEIKEEYRFEQEDGAVAYYDATTVFGDSITPNYADVEYPQGIGDRFKELYSVNEDTVGWLRIEDTNIDHVILQTENNDDYLRATFYGDYYVGGSLFMDYRNVLGNTSQGLSKNTIIYGHYLENQRGMFSDLNKYMDVEYYKEHPIIEMSTLYRDYQWKIIGAFLAANEAQNDNALFYYWYDSFSDSNTLAYANEVAFRSYFVNPSIDVEPTDKFLTLSTCSHLVDINGVVNARFVVVARLVREGESTDVDVSAAYDNPDRRMPQLWYDLNGLQNPYSQYAIWDAYA